jgi:ribonucleoside-diphosphate reductase alpha chain
MESEDTVVKRNGDIEVTSFDKIVNRIRRLGDGELEVNYTELAKKIIERLYDQIPTERIDELLAQQCASLCTTHHDYGTLASRVIISNHTKNTSDSFYNTMNQLYNFHDIHDKHSPLVSKAFMDDVASFMEDGEFKIPIDYDRDNLIDYFGFKTLERAYLMRTNGKILERPQHMWMRVSIGIHGNNRKLVEETYNLMSQKYFTHATPTLFNAGTPRPQLSSCYLIGMEDDSIQGIYSTLTDCAKISKWAGGIGMHIHNIRASGSHIRGTNGTSNGLVPMLRVFNNTARYVDQCVLPETIIYTTRGPMEIQHCVAGDTQIFTTDGCETINNVLEHSYSGEILHINSVHSFKNLTITPEHPVYCLKNQTKGLNYSVIKNRIVGQTIKPEWIEAKDLTMDDMLIFTKPNYEKDNNGLSKDDCYMYGLLLGDGCMNNSSTSCYISLHSTDKQDNLNFVKTYLTKKCVKYFINTENNTSRIRWNKSIDLPFRYATLYDENKDKFIHTSWLNLPIEKVKYIVKGLIDSDGCVTKEIVFDTTSLKLVEALRYLLLRMGIPTGGYIRDRIGEKHVSKYGCVIENKKISYCLRIPKTKEIAELFSIGQGQFHKFFEHNNLIYTRISDIERGTYEGTLYDLQLTKTHNYLIHNGVIHNGGGKRSGSFAIYLEPWHKDIVSFLDMKKNHGDEDQRARDLFYALWIPDLFMKRVKEDKIWTLMCPDQCRGLSDVYGDEFEELYCKYEKVAPEEDKIRARDLWFKILDSQIETGTPYMLYKDACNKKSNQQNLGTIKSSNLCTEIIEYSDENQTAVCNLASIGLPKFVKNKIPEGPIKIYSKTNCKYCKRAKKMLSEMNVKFEEILLDDDEKRRDFYKTMKQSFNKDVNSVPQILIDDKLIGGYMEFKKIVKPYFDYDLLHSVTKVAVNNLNKVIDVNFYPTNKTRLSNLLHRPIGLGIQGLADVFAMLDIPFHSDEAKKINVEIFETLYHAAVTQSKDIAKERMEGMHKLKSEFSTGGWKFKDDNQVCQEYIIKDPSNVELYNELEKYKPIKPELTSCDKWNLIGSYSSFTGSPAHKGQLQYDLWNVTPSNRYDWNTLKFDIDQYGMRNSLLMAPMPTASTSQILGNNECFEPFTSNIYVRRTIAGEFVIINKHLIKELIELDKWSDANKNNIIANNGSVQSLDISDRLKRKYKTVWEIPMKHLLEMSADRGPFICQSQSTNLWMKEPDYKKLTAMHMFAWEKGLKTGIYYLRTRAKAAPQQFTIDPTANKNIKIEDDEGCLMCSG